MTISRHSAPRRAPGWRRIARPKCASRCATRATPAGAAATRSSRARRRSAGWRSMAERGWTVPDWPKDYGGGGLSPAETKVLQQEMARIGARNPLMSFGISMLGPALLKYGNEEQKKQLSDPDRARRDPLVPGLFRAGRRLRPRQPADQVRGQGRSLAGQRPEGLDQLRRQGRLDLLPGPHRSAGAQASGDQLPAVRHGEPGRLDQADPADLRQFALLRDLLRRREGAQGPAGRRAEQGLGRRQISARPRARDDLGHGPGRAVGLARRGVRRRARRRSAAPRRHRPLRRRRAWPSAR